MSFLHKEPNFDYLFKILLIGDSGVGKSSIMTRYIDGHFSETFISTIGVDFKIRNVEVEGKNIKLQVWDCAGQERFRSITSSYYRGAHGVLLVYDITDRSTFESLNHWYDEVDKLCNFSSEIFIIGNKSDMEDRKVNYEDGEKFAESLDCRFTETNEKEDQNVEKIVNQMAENLYQKELKKKELKDSKEDSRSLNQTIRVGQKVGRKKRRKTQRCC